MLCCGCAPCAPFAGDGDVEESAAGGAGVGAGDELADRQPRPVVHAVHGVAGKAFEQAVLQHRQRAADAFLGRLEDEVDGAVEVARLREVLRRAQQHRGVAVMTAGVHPAGVLAGVRQVGGLQDRQRVHVGAQAHRGFAIAVAQHADHAGLADAAMHLDAPFLQLVGHQLRRAVFLQAKLRMGVDIAADGDKLVLIEPRAIDRRLGAAILSDSGWSKHGFGHRQVPRFMTGQNHTTPSPAGQTDPA